MGWSNSISEVTSDVTYTAKFIQMSSSDWVAGIQPVVSEDGKTIQYGFYPQSNVNDQSLINVLNTLTPSEVNGWYFYDVLSKAFTATEKKQIVNTKVVNDDAFGRYTTYDNVFFQLL